MNLSLMSCPMMRVISSPSSSTTGFLTLILVGDAEAMLRDCGAPPARRRCSPASLIAAVEDMLRGDEEGDRRRAWREDLLVAAPTTADRRGFMWEGGTEEGF